MKTGGVVLNVHMRKYMKRQEVSPDTKRLEFERKINLVFVFPEDLPANPSFLRLKHDLWPLKTQVHGH